jgi:hypothetical protein
MVNGLRVTSPTQKKLIELVSFEADGLKIEFCERKCGCPLSIPVSAVQTHDVHAPLLLLLLPGAGDKSGLVVWTISSSFVLSIITIPMSVRHNSCSPNVSRHRLLSICVHTCMICQLLVTAEPLNPIQA